MDNKLLFTGGEPNMSENDFMRVQQANREAFQSLLKDYGNTIIGGAECVDPGSGSDLIIINDGFVYLNNEMLKVDAGTYTVSGSNAAWKYTKITTYESGGDKTYQNGTPRQTWEKNRAVPTSVSAIAAGELDCVNGDRINISDDWHLVDDTGEPPFNSTWGIDSPGLPSRLRFKFDKGKKNIIIYGTIFSRSVYTSLVFTLPSGYIPNIGGSVKMPIFCDQATDVHVEIDTSGNVSVFPTPTTNGTYYFNITIPLTS